jgi:hypothetical protein
VALIDCKCSGFLFTLIDAVSGNGTYTAAATLLCASLAQTHDASEAPALGLDVPPSLLARGALFQVRLIVA